MPITIAEEFIPDQAMTNGGAPAIPVFHISETVEVYDVPVAQLINHLFNHLHVLAVLAAGSFVAVHDFDTLAQHSRYETMRDGTDHDPTHLMQLLREECDILLDYLVRLGALNINGDYRGRNALKAEQLLAAAQDRVPLLHYRYDNPEA